MVFIGVNILPVTERARKLRAQYAMQAQSLRSRIELRVNRIPTALRKTNMGELYAKYENSHNGEETTAAKGEPSKVPTVKLPLPEKTIQVKDAMPLKGRGKKRIRYPVSEASRINC